MTCLLSTATSQAAEEMTGTSSSHEVTVEKSVFLAIVVLYAAFVTYDEHADTTFQTNQTDTTGSPVYQDYPFFTDTQVMIFVHVFLWLYGLEGMAFNKHNAHFSTGILPVQP